MFVNSKCKYGDKCRKKHPRYIEAGDLDYFSFEDVGAITQALGEITTCKAVFDRWGTMLDE
jgi:hypothetical protein